MRVRVLFFGILKEIVGKPADEIDLPDGASVRDVLAHYGSQMPRLRESLPSLALAVNQQYAGPDTKLKPDDEIALLPPVSGGAPEPAGRQRYATIVREVIDTQRVVDALKRGEDGAALVFEGVVRNQTRGRKTLYLDYEAYEEMALQQMDLLQRHLFVRFVVEIKGLAATGLVADHSLKYQRGAVFPALEGIHNSLRVDDLANDRCIALAPRRLRRATTHRRQQSDLVVRLQFGIGPRVLLVHGQGQRWQRFPQAGHLRSIMREHIADRSPIGQIDLIGRLPDDLFQNPEEEDSHSHRRSVYREFANEKKKASSSRGWPLNVSQTLQARVSTLS